MVQCKIAFTKMKIASEFINFKYTWNYNDQARSDTHWHSSARNKILKLLKLKKFIILL